MAPECAASLPHCGMIELAIAWPFLLDDVRAMKLVVFGRLIRRDNPELR